MRVHIEESRCVAAGLCVMAEDTVFDQDEDTGTARLLVDHPGPAVSESVREAARICPALAITIVDDEDA